jgi:hypothetical protein
MRFLIPATFFALALMFVLDVRRGVALPIPAASGVAHADLLLGPPRQALGDPPTIQNGQYRQTCSECHALFPSPEVVRDPLLQHTHIVLDHGLNDRCYNCHSRENRDLLVKHGGETIGFAAAPELCSQCHGTVFRDWQDGIHGRTTGSWETNAPAQRRLGCNECHDPHSPAYPRLAPLPGPNTLRMGAQDSAAAHGVPENPLEKWKNRGAAAQPPHEDH